MFGRSNTGQSRGLEADGARRRRCAHALIAAAALIQGCADRPEDTVADAAADPRPPNILVIVGDDMGIETLSGLGVGPDAPPTPNLDALARRGVSFTNFWVQPTCSPTRATILTGRYGFRTGIGRVVGGPVGGDNAMGFIPEPPAKPGWAPREVGGGSPTTLPPTWGLGPDELGLPAVLKADPELGYATAAFGKWHLADVRNGWERHANLFGFDHFHGLLRGTPDSYFGWTEVVDGQFVRRTGYNPSTKVDDTLAWISAQGERPWFVWLSFNLPHTPLHLPPQALWVTDHSDLDPNADPNDNPAPYFEAMMEALDTEIGRLLDSVDDEVLARTYVIFLGDNGTSGRNPRRPFERGRIKGTHYRGGINVPLFVAGPRIPEGRTSAALVNSVDLFATILEMAGLKPGSAVPRDVELDSVSFLAHAIDPELESTREWIYSDSFDPAVGIQAGNYAIRNASFKLIHRDGEDELYDLAADAYERVNLIERGLTERQRLEYERLEAQIATLHRGVR